ncbi:universal stress protein [Hydrotalea sp.]|uniref:universal stress protein n=1 Tax=Hydrotalea sp. TaxID=2881279 RepID=UPI00261A7D89|nr:universal stress protein [Hydrotalea sp.]
MKTILIPTDFSETAKHTAIYAMEIARQIKAEKVILYNTYQTIVTVGADPLIPAVDAVSIENLKKGSEEGLQNLKFILLAYQPENVMIKTLSEFNLLTAGIQSVCERMPIDVIIMGITGGDAIEENLFGSNTIQVAKNVTVPVIIVPKYAPLKPIEKILFLCDFEKVVETTPVQPIIRLLDATKAAFHVLNIDKNNSHFTPETPHESLMLHNLFHQYNPQYHFVDGDDFMETANSFVKENNIDLIVSIPKRHGLFETLFKRSHTKMMAFHSIVPLMVVHE